MSENTNNQQQQIENFNFNKHFLNAILGSLYYVFVYIPFILPFKIWGQAAARISILWEKKSLGYDEKKSNYPLFIFYFKYVVDFVFDAAIFLAWPFGIIFSTYTYIDSTYFNFEDFILMLGGFYLSVLYTRFLKELLNFFLNYLVVWMLDVIKNIGLLIKNMWLLNFVFKNKK
tara:strand:- start:932 stop:1450 length:519 start_codon:yes stop_codon:yes gene_type:complete